MKANAVAETPPVISSMTPRSQVMRETGHSSEYSAYGRAIVKREANSPNIDENRIVVVKNR